MNPLLEAFAYSKNNTTETDNENTGRSDIAIVFSSDSNTSEKYDAVIIELR